MKNAIFLLFLSLPMWASAWTIRTPENPSPAEVTAAQELKKYLEKSVKGALTIEGKEPTFYIGLTPDGTTTPNLADEEWKVYNVGSDIVLIGGGSRGTLYAVYRFLEDILKVRFWTTKVESIPTYEDLRLDKVALSGKPYFLQRDIYRSTLTLIDDDSFWNYRNRLNRNGDTPVSEKLGGSYQIGSPYHVHTFEFYVNSGELLASHPEYFSLVNGKRVGGQITGQICLTNPDVKKLVVKKLREYIEKDRAAAKAAGVDAPKVYDISQNDNRLYCQGDVCEKAMGTGNQSDLLIGFINSVADEIKEDYPDVSIQTLAYLYTEEPPVNVTPRDNVIIRFCDTATNPGLPISDPVNRNFGRKLQAWSKVAKTLSVWDYSITYVRPGMPFPHEYTLSETAKAYRDSGVKLIFWEHEFPECSDMWELTSYLEAKVSEDPDCDVDKWKREFISSYYGAAAPFIEEYRDLLNAATLEIRPKIGWFAAPVMFDHLNVKNLKRFDEILVKAVEAVKGDPEMVKRVERVRLSVDRAILLRNGILANEYLSGGGKAEDFPFDIPTIAERTKRVWTQSIQDSLVPAAHEEAFKRMFVEVDGYKDIPLVASRPPKRFASFDQSKIHDFPSYKFSLFDTFLKMVPDPDAETGTAIKIDAEKMKLPIHCGLHASDHGIDLGSFGFEASQISGPGYRWYKVATSSLYHISILTFGWLAQMPLDSLTAELDKPEDGKKYEAWLRLKFTGPAFPYGKPDEENAIWIDRAVLVEQIEK